MVVGLFFFGDSLHGAYFALGSLGLESHLLWGFWALSPFFSLGSQGMEPLCFRVYGACPPCFFEAYVHWAPFSLGSRGPFAIKSLVVGLLLLYVSGCKGPVALFFCLRVFGCAASLR